LLRLPFVGLDGAAGLRGGARNFALEAGGWVFEVEPGVSGAEAEAAVGEAGGAESGTPRSVGSDEMRGDGEKDSESDRDSRPAASQRRIS
jgi:hypothetical protein